MNTLIISHIADIDGITPIILGKLVFGDIDYELYEISQLDEALQKHLDSGHFDKYDNVFITDLTVEKDMAEKIAKSPYCKKIKIFDHHLPSLELSNYEFSYSKVNDYKGLVCGTSLFYEFLLDNYDNVDLPKKAVADFVELVRLNDTWELKKENNTDARDLATLHALYGNETFISRYFEYLKNNDEFKFEDSEKLLLEMERKRINDYVSLKEKQLRRVKLLEYNVGVVFAELYRSELGNMLAERHKDLDFIVIVNMGRSVSYRGVKNIDLNEISTIFGGHGHLNAAGSPLPDGIYDLVLKEVFEDKIEF